MPLFYVQGMPIGGVSIMLALVASMGGFIFGYDTGQISDILLMEDFKLRFATCSNPVDHNSCEFSTVRAGLIVSLLSIGTLFGALIGALVADKLGRRRAMVCECCLFVVGVIIQLATFTVWQQVAVGRLISGLAVGALSAAVPMYQAETAPTHLRGTLTATYQLFITLGILVAYCIGIGTRELSGAASWRTLIGLGIIWPVILGVGILFMPESPRWCAAHGKVEAARNSIARTYGIKKGDTANMHFVNSEVDDIVNQIENEKRIKAGWIDCFRPANKTLYRTLLGMALQSFQQLTGANYFFYYGATIFQSVGIQDSFVTQIILGAVNFGCTFGGLYVMQRFGRRRPLIIGGIWQAVWLFVFAAAGTAKDPTENKNIGTLMIVSACLFIFGYAMTWAPGIWILIGETFPTRTRAKQGALATASNWLWNFLIAFFTPFITSAIKFRYGFVFAACNLTAAVVVYFFLYESSDLSLESVDNMYNDPDCKPWTSHRWAPAGYSSRHDLVQQTKAAQSHKPLASGALEEKYIENTSEDTKIAPNGGTKAEYANGAPDAHGYAAGNGHGTPTTAGYATRTENAENGFAH
ncbi:general substrate transporter [Crucibulum laeve]|uniref:General substrate transporter n=1 Tax=Crucibulum laeve TaxID=68775 RepID=A0A5C3M042_9AGAR|nr:general substrate transporter [Crucibulum laeve]